MREPVIIAGYTVRAISHSSGSVMIDHTNASRQADGDNTDEDLLRSSEVGKVAKMNIKRKDKEIKKVYKRAVAGR